MLQKEFNEINKEIYAESPLDKNMLVKFEEADTLVQDHPIDYSQLNLLKETREKIFEAQKAWENLIYSQNRKKQFVDNKSRELFRYKNIADSLASETNNLRLDNIAILDSIIGANINLGKIDSLLKEYLFEKGDKLPLQVDFVRKLDSKSYQRMMTLREEDLSILQKGKKPYKIKLVNNSNNKIFVAVRYFAFDQQWVVSGWYSLSAKGSQEINMHAQKNEFYFYARVEGGNRYYGDGPSYFVSADQAFTIVEKYDTDLFKQELKPFFAQWLDIKGENRVVFSE